MGVWKVRDALAYLTCVSHEPDEEVGGVRRDEDDEDGESDDDEEVSKVVDISRLHVHSIS